MESKYIKRQNLLGGILLLGSTLISLPTAAQSQTHPKDTTLNRTVVVEQQYNPDIMDAQKVNVLPKIEELKVIPNKVEYDSDIAPSSAVPATTMSAYAGEEKQDKTKPGYVRFGYGNRGNLDAKASYLFMFSGKDRLGINLDVEGMNGKREMKSYSPSDATVSEMIKWDSRFYRTQAGIDYLHQFDKLNLDIAGNFGLSNFNFHPASMNGRQIFTSGDVHFGVKSTDKALLWQYSAEANLLFYTRGHNFADDISINENIVRTKADITRGIEDNQRLGVKVEMNNMFYNNDLFENYTMLLSTPYYETSGDSWNLHAGANIDLSFGLGEAIRVSPDLKAQYMFSDSYVLYANATGGNILSDFRRLELVNPYADLIMDIVTPMPPYYTQKKDSYEQLNAVIGFKASPITGLWFNLYAGYQNIKDDLLQNSYKPSPYPYPSSTVYSACFRSANTNNVNAGLQVSYEYKDLFFISGEGQYYNWNADQTDYDVLRLKPALRFELQAGIRPIAPLCLNMGYQYIQREEFETANIGSYREDAINNVTFNASYKFPFGLSVYTRASNLLNKKYTYYLAYPVPGVNFVGGVSFSF